MDVLKSSAVGGSLQISTDVIAKIARLATLEVDGVQAVCGENLGVKGLLPKARALKPIEVSLSEDVAQITVSIQVRYGSKVPALAEKVQESVKSAVQKMTGITVSKVNVVVAGVAVPSTEPGEAE